MVGVAVAQVKQGIHLSHRAVCTPGARLHDLLRDAHEALQPINASGYHISEAGASPLHEVAFTLANLVTYHDEVTKTGMHVDEFAPRLAFFFVSQADFFQEIAKFRAVRRCYAKIMKERFGARNPWFMRLRFPCQTAAATLTKP